jgi:hypothetical protein
MCWGAISLARTPGISLTLLRLTNGRLNFGGLGKGIASSLVKKAIEISKNNGAYELYVQIAGNSRGFWEKIVENQNIELISEDNFIIKF